MAKKGNRQMFGFTCTVCKGQNYVQDRNRVNVPEKIELTKFCNKCRKHTKHRENSKLK